LARLRRYRDLREIEAAALGLMADPAPWRIL
jgi:hypothetical protein